MSTYHIGFVLTTIYLTYNLTSVKQSHVVATLVIILIALGYWYTWARFLPRLGGYRLEREVVIQEDGVSRTVLKKVALW
jgi:predicted Na+-dependent transporter